MRNKAGWSIRKKLITAIVFSFVLVCVVFCISSVFYFQKVFRRQIIYDETQKMEKIMQQISYLQQETQHLASAIIVDPEIQKCAQINHEMPTVDKFLLRGAVSERLSQYIQQSDTVNSVYLICDTQMLASRIYDQESVIYQEENWDWYDAYKDQNNARGFTKPHWGYVDLKKQHFISYVQEFRDMITGNYVLGDIVLNIDFAHLDDILKTDSDMLEGYLLLDQNGEPIIEYGISMNDDLLMDTEANPAKDGIIIVRDDIFGWSLVFQISDSAISGKLSFIPGFFGIAFLAVLLLLLAILYPLIANLTAPIVQLTQLSDQIGQGDLEHRIAIRTGDELEQLGNSFNSMQEKLQVYIAKSIEDEKVKKDMQLHMLLLQINPHFIFNTLNNIIYLAQFHKNEQIIEFTKAFISLLQESLVAGKEKTMIPLEQEIQNVDNYALLCQYKYPDKFTISYHLQEEVRDFMVPRIMLQPLIENAIIHGIWPEDGIGHISVSAFRESGMIVILIADDGVGMAPEVLTQIMKESGTQVGKMHGIGIANVRERLRIIYGDRFRMEIESRMEAGTKIFLKIPLQEDAFD